MEVGGGFICEVPDCVTEGGSSPGPLGAGLFSMPRFEPDTQKSGPRPHQRGKTSQPLHGANYFFADLSKFFLTFAVWPGSFADAHTFANKRSIPFPRYKTGYISQAHVQESENFYTNLSLRFIAILHKYFEYSLLFMCLFYISTKKQPPGTSPGGYWVCGHPIYAPSRRRICSALSA